MEIADNFEINDVVVHCREGLSTIISKSSIDGKDYFLVKVNNSAEETFYVPINSKNTIIRHVMKEKEADEILSYMKSIERQFNKNTKKRRDDFKRCLASGNIRDIAYLSRCLFYYNELGENNDEIKLGAVDLDMLNFAHNMLMDELCVTFNINKSKILDFIIERMKKIK